MSDTRVTWSVREEGNKVIIEIDLRDNYQAIELAEIIAVGMREGHLELEFEDDGLEAPHASKGSE